MPAADFVTRPVKTRQVALYALGSRSYKMPALDEFLNAQSPQQVDLFGSRQVQDFEGGIK